ncbi:MAG: biotin--[acetyl-CoA-carboxylase] ligase [Filomicrobium sp.]
MQDPFVSCQDPTPIIRHAELGSTNAEAQRLASRGEQGPLWIIAERQTAGRGRSGRSWQEASGNLFASLLVSLWCEPKEASRLSILAGIALAKAVETAGLNSENQTGQPPPSLKWPNDLMFGTAKAAGILVETQQQTSGALACIIGIGINVASSPEVADRPVTSLAETGYSGVTPDILIQHLDLQIRAGLATMAREGGFSQITQTWMTYAHPIGTPISVKSGDTTIEGEFAGLADDGALLLDQKGQRTSISYGDVSDPHRVI